MPSDVRHIPVLVEEILSFLKPRKGQVVVDCTLGGGGHAQALLDACPQIACLIGVDRDPVALASAKERLSAWSDKIRFAEGNFADLPDLLEAGGGRVDILLADLGLSSLQLDSAGRGFSFLHEGPLDMRMNASQGAPAWELVKTMSREQLVEALRENGERRFAWRIAGILKDLPREKIQSTTAVAEAIRRRVPRPGRIHPATRTFQTLRRLTNAEGESLRSLLDALPKILNPGALAAIVSFHSLEDRLVKHTFRAFAKGDFAILTPKPVTPSQEECTRNPRARSAKLRVLKRKDPDFAE